MLDVREEDGEDHRWINQEGRDNRVVAQEGDECDVFGCPCGTDAISGSAEGEDLSGTKYVLEAVATIKKSGAGSSKPCSRTKRRRERATSARFCSAACRLFFKADIVSIKETLESAPTGGIPGLAMTARISSRVKSGCLAIRAEIESECSSNGEALPPLRFGAALPVSLQRWHHRITELTPTLKISAISAATLRFQPLQPHAHASEWKLIPSRWDFSGSRLSDTRPAVGPRDSEHIV